MRANDLIVDASMLLGIIGHSRSESYSCHQKPFLFFSFFVAMVECHKGHATLQLRP